MNKKSRIYIAGHNGMVGSAINDSLQSKGYKNIITVSHGDLDLIKQNDVNTFFDLEKPEYIFIAAAKVGGIHANNAYRGQFLYENLSIQNNIIHMAYKYKVKKLLFLGSACIYPRDAMQPIKEEFLLSDYLEPTNEPYAIAKIAGIKLCENYFRQYNSNFISIMPNNLYGPNDNFDLKMSHVLPALLRKFHEAKNENNNSVEVWGTGSPLREFLHVNDLADASIFVMEKISANTIYDLGISHLNVGSGEEISIKDLAFLVREIVDVDCKIIFNHDYPNGTPRKFLDINRMKSFGWKSNITLKKGIKSLYKWYLNYLKINNNE